LLRKLDPGLAHFQHAVPLGWRGRTVVTLHDLHFERESSAMGRVDKFVFRTVVPRAARRADALLAVSERTRADAIELYGLPPDKIAVTLHGVDSVFAPGAGAAGGYLLFVGAVQARKDPLAAARAAREVGLPLIVAGPEKEPRLARELRREGADVRGFVDVPELVELYRGAEALVLPSRYEGFGLPVVEAMACGTPVVVADEPTLREIAGDAAVYACPGELAAAIRLALDDRERFVRAGLERARLFSWDETARRTVDVYRAVLA
jgi:glycosyltransferase involved in cell wall biosynthesis